MSLIKDIAVAAAVAVIIGFPFGLYFTFIMTA